MTILQTDLLESYPARNLGGNPHALGKRGRTISGPDVVRVWSSSFPRYIYYSIT